MTFWKLFKIQWRKKFRRKLISLKNLFFCWNEKKISSFFINTLSKGWWMILDIDLSTINSITVEALTFDFSTINFLIGWLLTPWLLESWRSTRIFSCFILFSHTLPFHKNWFCSKPVSFFCLFVCLFALYLYSSWHRNVSPKIRPTNKKIDKNFEQKMLVGCIW